MRIFSWEAPVKSSPFKTPFEESEICTLLQSPAQQVRSEVSPQIIACDTRPFQIAAGFVLTDLLTTDRFEKGERSVHFISKPLLYTYGQKH
jgi:hypothetical protein